jgi:hypothetical protein
MSEPDRNSFHVRLPADLKARLETARGDRSLNREIVERLERSFSDDIASQWGEILHPLVSPLSGAERAQLVQLIRSAVEILTRRS